MLQEFEKLITIIEHLFCEINVFRHFHYIRITVHFLKTAFSVTAKYNDNCQKLSFDLD